MESIHWQGYHFGHRFPSLVGHTSSYDHWWSLQATKNNHFDHKSDFLYVYVCLYIGHTSMPRIPKVMHDPYRYDISLSIYNSDLLWPDGFAALRGSNSPSDHDMVDTKHWKQEKHDSNDYNNNNLVGGFNPPEKY